MVRCDGEPVPESQVKAVVLVVEDEVLVRMMMADKLRDEGYLVIEAATGDEALQVLRHNSVDVQVIVTDVRMPGAIDGLGLAREVRSRHPLIKIVLTSAHLPKHVPVDHDGFFAKPYDPATIISHIKTLLD